MWAETWKPISWDDAKTCCILLRCTQCVSHSDLLAFVFDCTLSIRSLVHTSSEPQSLVKGTWNDRTEGVNIWKFWHFLPFTDPRQNKRLFRMSLHSFEAPPLFLGKHHACVRLRSCVTDSNHDEARCTVLFPVRKNCNCVWSLPSPPLLLAAIRHSQRIPRRW